MTHFICIRLEHCLILIECCIDFIYNDNCLRFGIQCRSFGKKVMSYSVGKNSNDGPR